MKLFGHQESGHAFKVKLALEIAKIKHVYEWVDIAAARNDRSREFRENARFQEVPMLLDRGQAYVQSNAILLHLANKYSVLGGDDEAVLARCKEWLFWEANRIGMCLPQIRVSRKFNDPNIQKETLIWLLARYDYDIGILDETLSDGRLYIVGDQFTIADCSLCGYLVFADQAEVTVPFYVSAWLQRISALDGWNHPYQLLAKR